LTRQRPTRFTAAVAAATLLALSLIGGASAAQPGWEMTVVKLPDAVSPGADAGYRITIVNNGPSNISQLYLTDSVAAPATYLTSTRAGCVLSPVLYCAFGALNAGDQIVLTVAHAAPSSGSSFAVTFMLNTTGASFNDKGKNSHGDTLTRTVTTGLDGDQNFAGGFVVATGTVANGSSLGRRNIQSTAATSPGAGLPVTVEDGSGVTFGCILCTGTPFGEWSEINVAEGASFGSGIEIVITIYSKSVPKNLDLSKVVVFHTYQVGGVDVTDRIDTACAPTPVPDCLTAQLLGNGDLEITIWTLHNGGFKPGLK